MLLRSQLRRLLIFLFPISVALSVYLYAYPVFLGCAFPDQEVPARFSNHGHKENDIKVAIAPFRLLALGDPQIEGNSAISDITDVKPWSVWSYLRHYVKTIRKRIDLVGNDYYLAHVYRTMYWWTDPTHVAVLGDLLGSQWISDAEFKRRSSRFWRRVFRLGEKVEDELSEAGTTEVLGERQSWRRKIINVAGNHDIGYAGDMDGPRIERFENHFGKVNWFIRYQLHTNDSSKPTSIPETHLPELRLVVLNSLNLDSPVIDSTLQGQTYDFVNHVILTGRPVEDKTAATVLLTHLPLHKAAGICVDSPYISYYDPGDGGAVKEQNHLSYEAGKGILEGIFGMSSNPEAPGAGLGRPGIILTGHDHEGCDVYHHISQQLPGEDTEGPRWNARQWSSLGNISNTTLEPGIREITVRSMMGEFGGNAGLLSGWYDSAHEKWVFEFATCLLGVQHIWWATHVVDLITLTLAIIVLLDWLHQPPGHTRRQSTNRRQPGSSEPLLTKQSKAKATIRISQQ